MGPPLSFPLPSLLAFIFQSSPIFFWLLTTVARLISSSIYSVSRDFHCFVFFLILLLYFFRIFMFLFHFFPSNPMLFHLFFGNKLVLPFEISFFSVKFEIFFSISIFLFGFAKPKLTRNKLNNLTFIRLLKQQH